MKKFLGVVVLGALVLTGCSSGGTSTKAKKAKTTKDTVSTNPYAACINDPNKTVEDCYTEFPSHRPAPVTTTTTAPAVPAQTFTGTGDNVFPVTIATDEAAIVHVHGNDSSRFFSVESVNAGGTQVDLLVNVTDPYDGYTLTNVRTSDAVTQLVVKSTGPYTIDVKALNTAPRVSPGTPINGQGDFVMIVDGSASSAHISGNAASRYFGVQAIKTTLDQLVNTTDPYDGTVLVSSPKVITTKAVGPWSITLNP